MSGTRLKPHAILAMPFSLTSIFSHFGGQFGRTEATIVVVLCCLLIAKLWGAYVGRQRATYSADTNRRRLVAAKNSLWVVGALAVFGIWASQIAGLVFSLAAIAGAIILVSKELILCVHGYFLILFSRLFQVGDFIEIGGNSGRVIDIGAFTTTLADTASVHQLTGKTLALPNSLFLSSPVKNVSATGQYIVNLYQLVLPASVDFESAEACGLAAAEEATGAWREIADMHFERIEAADFLSLPSSRPKVLWGAGDGRTQRMTIRFACPIEERVATEQAIFRAFWQRFPRPALVSAAEEPDA